MNTLQTVLFLCFGAVALVLIGRGVGGFDAVMERLASQPVTAVLLSRERVPMAEFFSYMFIPLSSIMFPHVAIMCLTARRAEAFRLTMVFYPICILLLWLPSVYLGVVAADQFPGLRSGESDDVMLRLLRAHAGPVTAGVLGAAIMACVMAADSQILALGTMFTRDVFVYYGGTERFGERAQVWTGRAFVVGLTVLAYGVALRLKDREGIFELAVRFAFTGYAALAPVMIGALYWKRTTKWGALAATLWVAAGMAGLWWLHVHSNPIAPGPGQAPVPVFPALGNALLRTPGTVTVFGFLPVVFLCLGSALLLWGVSLLTRPPGAATIEKYFPGRTADPKTCPRCP